MSLTVAAKHLLDDGPFGRLNFYTRRIARSIRMATIAVWGARPGKQDTGTEFHLTPPSHAFGNQGAFLFCHGAANLQQ